MELQISLSAAAYEQLQRRATHLGKPPEKVTQDILEEVLQEKATALKSTAAVLAAAGQVVPLSDNLRRMIIPGVTLEEVRASLSAPDGSSLSDIVLEQRGPAV